MTDLINAALPVLTDWRLLAAALATAIAGLMRGYAGFGTAVILAPIYSVLWGPKAGVPVMLLMELIVSIQLLPSAFKDADRRVILPIGGTAALMTPLGAYILITADGEVLRRAIGAFVLVFGGLLLSGWRYNGSRPLPLNMAVGAVSGLLKGLFFSVISVISVFPPLFLGLIDLSVLIRTAVLLPVMVLCVPIGARLFHVVPQSWYRPFARIVLIGAGSIALLV